MQDQMRFIDNEGNWYTNSKEIPSNHYGTYTKHGEWVLPVYPKALGMVGSMVTPYIWDSRCDFRDAFENLKEMYAMGSKERKRRGELGRKWAISDEAGFTAVKMANNFAEGMEELFATWKPRKNFVFYSDDDYKPRQLQHKLTY